MRHYAAWDVQLNYAKYTFVSVKGHNGRDTWRTSCYNRSRLIERTWRVSAETSHSYY